MARWQVLLVALLTALLGLVDAANGQEDDPFDDRPEAASEKSREARPKPAGRALTGRDRDGKPVEGIPFNPNSRPVLIDDTQPLEAPPIQKRRVFGVSRRGDLTAQPQQPATKNRTNDSVRAALESPTQMQFTEMPLIDGVAFLRDYHDIEIQLDEPALQAAGVGKDTPVTRNLEDLPLGSSLKLLLEPLGLTYLVRDGVLMVTTEPAAAKYLELKVYDVAKHIGPEVRAEEVAIMLSSLNHPQLVGGGMGGGSDPPRPISEVRVVPFLNLLIVRASQHEQEELVSLFAEMKRLLVADH